MTSESVQYRLDGQVATVRIDDGKRNALSPQVLHEIYAALDRAESDRATVILTGRESVFSAGFDLNVMKRGGVTAIRMLRSGYALTARVMAYPYPVIAACNGHAFAMGVFLMLSADYVVGRLRYRHPWRFQHLGKRGGYRPHHATRRCRDVEAPSRPSGLPARGHLVGVLRPGICKGGRLLRRTRGR
jgi:hypothetical protein